MAQSMEESGTSHLLDDGYDIQLAREMQQMEIMLASQDEQNVWLRGMLVYPMLSALG